MKTNKKAVLGMLVAIVISLGVIGGINNNNDSSLQQVSLGCGYMATSSEGGAIGAWTAASAMTGMAAEQIATGGTFLGWTPVGWGMWAGAGVCAL
ncbi:hypothetical protein J8K87_16025 [Bacteroides fragilis]|uniref:hypothetical protein n=1 Tax=Bacteroides fragilis TaxID=817 RepID=UPI001CAA2143|nr:hypothetical protein [Bacteroides fragilis]MBY2897306.1 hypothetical protein [Bacteroides fragilis]MCM0328225.1 hypothetical protein [Bacteroides fragilis]MCM0385691.1 hypothetical protein [Bacteroides fragilis]